ncbi:hypothetical protein CTTA_4074 [Comamonas testosteroni]|uniref:Uncharacterized protein n=1 Tax=Comamonas testosteroni TaxID=285 RepID=A0A5A7MJL8_COMTE|nr:DUF6631 family protein [Comamonas testosteroni]GEQ77069.1 hypothetical protein CTTA_4074 [Comamonas testosteroni]
MAKVVQKAAAAPAATREPSDMEVLHPERVLLLGGESVMVREYGNVEWLRLLPAAEPLVAAMTEMLDAPIEPTYEMVLNAIAVNTDGLLPLVLQAVGRDMDWLESLQSDEVENLLMTWWSVNFHFFVRRARSRQMVERASADLKRRIAEQPVASAGVPSTPPSSPMGTSTAT